MINEKEMNFELLIQFDEKSKTELLNDIMSSSTIKLKF